MPLEDKTEAPTERRRQEARQKGQVARSMELSSSLAMLAGLMTFKVLGPSMIHRMRGLIIAGLSEWPPGDLTMTGAMNAGRQAMLTASMIILPVLLAGMGVAIVVTVAQVGFHVTGEPLVPQLNRLDPFKGLTRLVSKRSFVELARSATKVAIVGYIMWATVREDSPRIAALPGAGLMAAVSEVGSLGWTLIERASLTILVIAIGDYIFQRRQHEQELKMTKQEVKEDMRRSEGDPTTRARIRQIMRAMAKKRMMNDVPKADVVVINPTHLALALKYDSKTMPAPMVLAKGQRLVAQRIVEIARNHSVPVIQNIPLARSLFKGVEVGQQVPLELYEAVAELLAVVYRMKGRTV